MLRIALIVSNSYSDSRILTDVVQPRHQKRPALDHQNHDTYIKYQSVLKSLDVQALVFDLEPDYECRNMEYYFSQDIKNIVGIIEPNQNVCN